MTFRHWADICDTYSFERSIVARHPALAGNPDAVETLLAQATYYYKVRYRLHSLVGPRRLVSERFGLVCSQFVGLLLHEAEVAGKRRALRSLPHDIDRWTRRAPWTRFSIAQSSFAEDRSASDDELAARLGLIQRKFDEFFAQQTDDAHGTIVALEKLDRLLLDDAERMMKARHSRSFLPDAQTAPPQTAPGEIDIEGLAGEALGATFLVQWRALYIDHQERAPRFIAQRMDSATATRQRKLLEDSVAGFHTALDTALKAFESYAREIQTTLKQCSGAGFVPPEIATLLIDYANNVRAMGSGFDFEAMPSLEKRIQQYDALIQDALVWATHQSEYIAKQGLSTLFAIKTCDELTAVWKRSATQLETLCSDLQPMQTGTT